MKKAIILMALMLTLIAVLTACDPRVETESGNAETPAEISDDTSDEISVDNSTETPVESFTETPADTSVETPAEPTAETSEETKVQSFIDTDVVIEKSGITKNAQYIPVEADGVKMEIIAVKASDDTIRLAFNTCQVCYDSGRGYYEQDGDVFVCQNCGNRFKTTQIGVKRGGCNPVGIYDEWVTQDDEGITIPLDLIKQAEYLFGNWKK